MSDQNQSHASASLESQTIFLSPKTDPPPPPKFSQSRTRELQARDLLMETAPSPPVQHHSPVAHASPTPFEASPPGGLSRSVVKTGQRASIACVRCRTSKTKCENKGIGTPCQKCQDSNKKCEYSNAPTTTTASTNNGRGPQRRESGYDDADAPAKKRKRQHHALAPNTGSSRTGLGTLENALESPLLTWKVWKELFEIYEKHFAIDFPFIHRRSFFDDLELVTADVACDTKSEVSSAKRPHHIAFMLAFLTQTARFHDELVQHGGSAIATANFYAAATRAHLGTLGSVFPEKVTRKLIQAHLMLGYHEWTNGEGDKGFHCARFAMSSAQLLGYQHDADRDDHESVNSKDAEHERDQFIEREIERRTIWSCFCMDRYLSMKEKCPQMFRVDELDKVQLVCSDEAFRAGKKVRTRLLGEDDYAYEKRRHALSECNKRLHDEATADASGRPRSSYNDHIRWELDEREAEMVFCIRAVDILSDVVRWSLAKGRRQEGTTPPWREGSKFKKLEDAFTSLQASLPPELRLTSRNTKDRSCYGGGWDKEYMAFAPWNLEKPQGPVDPPKLLELPPTPTYWINQAKRCWKVCQEFTELLYESKKENALVENPIVAFATYTVGWCAIYCYYFPNMDPENSLHHRLRPICAWDVVNEYLATMSARFYKAEFWMRELQNVKNNYRSDRMKYKAVGGQPQGGSPSSTSSDRGGGLKEYAAIFEKKQKEFGGQNFSSRDWDGKDIKPADLRLSEHPEFETDRREAATPAATPKVEMAGTPVTATIRTPTTTSQFTSINTINPPVNQDNPLPTTEYPSIDGLSQKYSHPNPPIHRPHSDPQVGTAHGYNHYQVASGHYPVYQPEPAYMQTHTDNVDQISQDYSSIPYTHAAFGPFHGNVDMFPNPHQLMDPEQVKHSMEGRGMNNGDMAAFGPLPIDPQFGTWMANTQYGGYPPQ